MPGQLLLVVDDVNRGLLGGGCASVDTDVISQQVRVYVFAKPLIRRDKPDRTGWGEVASLGSTRPR